MVKVGLPSAVDAPAPLQATNRHQQFVGQMPLLPQPLVNYGLKRLMESSYKRKLPENVEKGPNCHHFRSKRRQTRLHPAAGLTATALLIQVKNHLG